MLKMLKFKKSGWNSRKYLSVIGGFLLPVLLLSTTVVHAWTLHDSGSNTLALREYQQLEIITGTVVDSRTGEPLPGVNILVRGTTTGTTTNPDGEFELDIEDTSRPLVFSYIGYEPQVVTLDGRTDIRVELVQDIQVLDDLVVVGYGSQKRENLTGSVDYVGGDELENRNVPNISQGLQGMIPNLNIQPLDGKPVESPSINIRGTTSIGQGGDALVLIDGVEGDPSMLNPADIESISVLKDASSAAVYGARGAFGVVLITTKEPETDQISVTYNGNFGFKKPTILPDFSTDPLIYATRFAEGFILNSGNFPQNVNKTLPFSQEYLEELERRVNNPGLPRTDVGPDGLYRYYHSTDWYGLLYKDRLMSTDHNLSVSGGTETTSFMVTGRYQGQDGLFRYNSDDFQILNLRAKGFVDITDWLRINNNFDISKRDYINPLNVGEGGGIWRNIADEGHVLAPMLNPDGTLTHSAAYTVGDFYLGNNNIDSEKRVIRNTTELVADLMDDQLQLRGNFTFQNSTDNSRRRRVPVPYSRAPGSIEYLGTQYNDLTIQNDGTDYVASNLYAEYENEFSGKHYFKAMLGGNYESSTFERVVAQRNGLIFPNAEDLNLALGQSIITQGGYEKWQIFGGFTRLNYIYDGRYLVEFNARYDGSSKFPEDERYAFFPSASVGWRISEENFWNVPENIISHLQLRASYGSMGNGNIESYVFQEIFDISQIGRIINGVRPQATSNPDVLPEGLTWETATTRNIGLDLEMLSGKLQFTGDAYVRETTDMFTRGLTPPAVFGAAPPFGNFADLETRGWELSLSWRDQFAMADKPFGYHVRVSLSDYVSEITRYNNPDKFLSDYYEGQKVGEIWGFETEGFFRDQADVENHADQSWFNHRGGRGFEAGDIKFRDLNGDGVIDDGDNTVDNPGDRRIIGNSSPRYSFGVNVGADWNNFFITGFFQGVLKQDWYPSSNAGHFWGGYNRIYNDTPNWHLEDGMIWTEEDPDPNAFFPRFVGYIALGSNRSLGAPQTKYLMNVGYVRLKNLQIGYNLPAQLTSRIGMRNAKVYVTGENLWSWSPLYKTANNVDVEAITAPSDQLFTGSNSGDGLNYPRLSSFAFGVSFTF
ncbi:SusC/RagA family TonB-linked outer membrane protein [Rhodohalobacter sp. 614A]|uniref:SusC/RagA family TonB-linked outer membrane protein n=1 Tax=Rhodohalobacter sp. 614A TaxID=2908649 RepID=UPI001F16D9FA|nr:TonB-dependent receptor [Rhodohalobacter sp. 614A]